MQGVGQDIKKREESGTWREGKQAWDREERMHQGWSAGVNLPMQSLRESGREGGEGGGVEVEGGDRGRLGKGIIARHVCMLQSCRSTFGSNIQGPTQVSLTTVLRGRHGAGSYGPRLLSVINTHGQRC